MVEGLAALCYHCLTMEINLLIDEGILGCPPSAWFERVVGEVLVAEGVGEEVEVGIVITGQERMQELNLVHRGLDEPTDVLSFAMVEELADAADDPELAVFVVPPDGIRHLGEVIVSFPQAALQAKEEGHSAWKETSILVVHGVLHLLGYDHAEVDDEIRMKSREFEILGRIGETDR